MALNISPIRRQLDVRTLVRSFMETASPSCSSHWSLLPRCLADTNGEATRDFELELWGPKQHELLGRLENPGVASVLKVELKTTHWILLPGIQIVCSHYKGTD